MADIGTDALGKVLQGTGTGSSPKFSTATYPSIATGTGKILRADGTNWAATTATYPNTAGTSGNVLTSDGTNWNSTAPASSGALNFAQVNISSTDWKNSFTTPIVILSAPPAGSIHAVFLVGFKLNYGGSNVFVAGGSVRFFYTTLGITSGVIFGLATSVYTGSVDNVYSNAPPNTLATIAIEGNGISIGSITSNPSGNAANDNTITASVWYQTVTMT